MYCSEFEPKFMISLLFVDCICFDKVLRVRVAAVAVAGIAKEVIT